MASKKDQIAQEVAKAVGAGKTVALETVDFNDPNRPKTCLEVDFPVLPINEIANGFRRRKKADLHHDQVVGATSVKCLSESLDSGSGQST